MNGDTSINTPQFIWDALETIYNGATADSLESEVLDFKEDPAVYSSSSNPDGKLIETLLKESICLANGEAGHGWIVIGVNDKKSGPDAFTGTQRQPEWLRQKIFNGTKPQMRVNVNIFSFKETRLILIEIPKALTVYSRPDGSSWFRTNTNCEPMPPELRQRRLLERANSDYSALKSEFKPSDVQARYVEEAERLLINHRSSSSGQDSVPQSKLGLLRELNLLSKENPDHLNIAGELLFIPSKQFPRLKHLWRDFPGAEPSVNTFHEPLITAMARVRETISTRAQQEIGRVHFPNGQESPIAEFPAQVIDEALSNAIAHRDWGRYDPVTIDQQPRLLKIHSPGSLPYGVTVDNLLVTQSTPRNPTLMNALHHLGLVEQTSRGFDRMWVSMLRTGRDAPLVEASDDHVEVYIAADTPNLTFMSGLHQLTQLHSHKAIDSVNTLIVLWHLFHHPLITLHEVQKKTQTNPLEAKQIMDWMTSTLSITEKARDADEWVLSASTREMFSLDNEMPTLSIQGWIESKLNSGNSLSAREVAEELGADQKEISRVLRYLRDLGRARIDPSGPTRGPTVRWIRR